MSHQLINRNSRKMTGKDRSTIGRCSRHSTARSVEHFYFGLVLSRRPPHLYADFESVECNNSINWLKGGHGSFDEFDCVRSSVLSELIHDGEYSLRVFLIE